MTESVDPSLPAKPPERGDGPRCPICRQPSTPPPQEGEKSPYPFCSDRCRLIDLGRWLQGAYQVPAVRDDRGEE